MMNSFPVVPTGLRRASLMRRFIHMSTIPYLPAPFKLSRSQPSSEPVTPALFPHGRIVHSRYRTLLSGADLRISGVRGMYNPSFRHWKIPKKRSQAREPNPNRSTNRSNSYEPSLPQFSGRATLKNQPTLYCLG
jgi:hypothetical protein